MKKPGRLFAIITLIISFCMAFAVTKAFFGNISQAKRKIVADPIETMQDGDVIFQTSQSVQCEAVRIATNSKFSHCGMIITVDNRKMVLEAVHPVKLTNINDWIAHGKDQKYVLKRLINSEKLLNVNILKKMSAYGNSFLNKNYDIYFNWSDSEIYC